MSDDKLPDLGAIMSRIIDSGVTDVADVALKVREQAPAEVLEAHLLSFLRMAVRDHMAKRRAANPVLRGTGAATHNARRVIGRPAVGLSAKQAARRNQFADDRKRWLADTLWIGERRVMLADATAGDLFAAARSMREQAARSEATAVRLEQIADVLTRTGIATVGALPDADLQALMART